MTADPDYLSEEDRARMRQAVLLVTLRLTDAEINEIINTLWAARPATARAVDIVLARWSQTGRSAVHIETVALARGRHITQGGRADG